MNHEQLLVSKIIEEQDLLGLTEMGLRAEHFCDPKARVVYQRILTYARDYGEVPTYDRIHRDFPNFNWQTVAEPVEDLYDLTMKGYRLAVLEDALNDAVQAFDDEDDAAVQAVLHKALNGIVTDSRHVRDVDITQNGEARLERYASYREMTSDIRGIATGFRAIDKATQGLQPQQLITLVGPPKAGKSTTMLMAARTAHLAGYRPLLIGFEMSNEEQEERLDAIAAGVSHHRLRSGSLTKDEEKALRRSVHSMESMKPFILSNDSQSTTVLSGVAAKVEKYKPDLLIVDGVYMMQDENGETPGSPQALTNITRGFKRLAQNLQIPIMITTQVLTWKMDRKRGITDNSIGYSSSFAQDSDVIIGVESTDDEQVKKIKVVIARNCPPMETYVRWDWESGTFEEIDDYEADQAEYEGARF